MLLTSFILVTLYGLFRSKKCGWGWWKSPRSKQIFLICVLLVLVTVIGTIYKTQPYSLTLLHKGYNSSTDAGTTLHHIDPAAFKVTFNTSVYGSKKYIFVPSVIAHMEGGIGDQLFSYACAYALARKLDQPLYTSHTHPTNSSVGERSLDQFRIPLLEVLDADYAVAPTLQQEYLMDKDLLEGSYRINSVHHVTAHSHSLALLSPVKDDLLLLFRLKDPAQTEAVNELTTRISNSSESVAVHIYYSGETNRSQISFQKNGIAELSRDPRLNLPPTFFLFFLNNPPPAVIAEMELEFRNNHTLPNSLHFIYNLTLPQVMQLSLGCKHFVIPDSSYSWWVAYLGGARDEHTLKIVYATPHPNNGQRKRKGKLDKLKNKYYPPEWNIRSPD